MNIILVHLVNTIITFVGWILFAICCNSSNSTTYTDMLWLLAVSTIMAWGLDALVICVYERRQDRMFEEKRERMNPNNLYMYLKNKPVIHMGYDKDKGRQLNFMITSATKTFIGGTRIEWKMSGPVCGMKLKGTAQLIKTSDNNLNVINYCNENGYGLLIPNRIIETIAYDLNMTTKYDINDATTYTKLYKD